MDAINNNNDLQIFIVTHKENYIPNIEGYSPIEVGAFFHDKKICDIRDNIGDNISSKNPNYCELTAYYWIWKNVTAKYVGLVHYRRFLSSKRISDDERYFLSKKKTLELLEKYDAIFPETIMWKDYTVAEAYDHGSGHYKDLEILRGVISDICPEYLGVYDQVTSGHEASYSNILVIKKQLFDLYCEWLFTILSETEKRVDISNYTVEEKRIFGFMSEILLNVWSQYNQISYYNMPVVMCNRKMRKTLKLLKLIEKIPFTDMIVRYGLYLDFNRQQRIGGKKA